MGEIPLKEKNIAKCYWQVAESKSAKFARQQATFMSTISMETTITMLWRILLGCVLNATMSLSINIQEIDKAGFVVNNKQKEVIFYVNT